MIEESENITPGHPDEWADTIEPAKSETELAREAMVLHNEALRKTINEPAFQPTDWNGVVGDMSSMFQSMKPKKPNRVVMITARSFPSLERAVNEFLADPKCEVERISDRIHRDGNVLAKEIFCIAHDDSPATVAPAIASVEVPA